MDWGTMHQPFTGVRRPLEWLSAHLTDGYQIRAWVREKSSLIWTVTTTQPQRPNLGRISAQSSSEQAGHPRDNNT
jgi:hypothetical protein